MGVRIYDEALWTKINKWVKDDKMTILKPDETTRLFSQLADQNNDKPLKLPIIALSRNPEIEILNQNKGIKTFSGKHVVEESSSSGGSFTQQLNAIPIAINYQLDIYTRHYEEGDEYLRNFIFNFINYPKMYAEINYNGYSARHVCYIKLNTTVSDNSDIPERLVSGQFTRWTILLSIQDAYLFSVPTNQNYQIELDELELRDSDNIVSEVEKLNLG